MKVLSADVVVRNAQLEGTVLRTTNEGACVFFDDGCVLHRELGSMGKPGGCRRFPFRLVATPLGGRVVTEHRCPCRTMGDRPPVSLAEAESSLRDEGARIRRDHVVSDRIKRTRKRTMSFAAYAREEAQWIARILAGEDPREVLEAQPLPPLTEVAWSDVAHEYRSRIDGSACGDALAWFGDVLLEMTGSESKSIRNRPWSAAYDRAQSRSPRAEKMDDVLADWLADAVWSMDWSLVASLETGRAELVTRWFVARRIAEKLRSIGVREDRAAAEGVTVVEIVGASGLWQSILRSSDRVPR